MVYGTQCFHLLKASVAQFLIHSPCNPGFGGSIPGFSDYKTTSRLLMTIAVGGKLNSKSNQKVILFSSWLYDNL